MKIATLVVSATAFVATTALLTLSIVNLFNAEEY